MQNIRHRHMRNKRMVPYSFLFFLFIAFQSRSFAQDTLSVEKAIATALQNNYDIRLARNDSIVAALNYSYRNAALLPQANATSTYLLNNNAQRQTFEGGDIKTRNGIQTGNTNAGLALNWTLFNGFQMFIGRTSLRQLLELGTLTAKNQVVNTVSDVTKTYYDIVRQKQQLKNIQEQMALSADQLKLAQYKFDIGTGIKPDLLQAQIDYNQQRAAQLNQLATIDKRKQDLASLMNVSKSINYEVSDTIPIQMDIVLGDLLNNLDQASPQLQIAGKNIEVARTNVRLARTNLFPTIGFTTAYNFAKTNNNAVINPAFQPLLSVNHGFNYGFTFAVPIFNQFAIRQQINQAKLAVNFQQLNYKKQESTINDSVLNVYRTYDAQKKIITVADSTIALSRENLNIARERYRLGVTTFIELRQAEQNLEQAETTLITARYNLKVAETELLRLKGDLIRRQ